MAALRKAGPESVVGHASFTAGLMILVVITSVCCKLGSSVHRSLVSSVILLLSSNDVYS